jgi:hypothetical protein
MKGAESSGVACKWQTKGVRVERVGVSAYGRVGANTYRYSYAVT